MIKKSRKQKDTVLRNPLTVKALAAQVKYACDLYSSLSLSEKELKELFIHYANVHGRKLFGTHGNLNPTVLKVIGKKRTELVEIMLSEYQLKII